jgi:antitoxin VapB
MASERHVKLFRIGRNRVVRSPRAFELPGKDAIMRKEDDRLILEAAPAKPPLAILAALAPLDDAVAPIADLPLDPVEL